MKFSDLKEGDSIYKLILNDNINYDGNFSEFVEKELEIKIEEIKIHLKVYPGMIQTGPYYAMTPHGNKATYGEKEDNRYINIFYNDNNVLHKLILENKEYSRNYTNMIIDNVDGIFFISKQELDKYIYNYCNKYIHQYNCQIQDLKEKIEKYQKFLNVYRS